MDSGAACLNPSLMSPVSSGVAGLAGVEDVLGEEEFNDNEPAAGIGVCDSKSIDSAPGWPNSC